MALMQICSTINGTYVDITEKIKPRSFTVKPIIVAPKSGRANTTGMGFSKRVAEKKRVGGNFQPLFQSETETIFPILSNEYVYVNYLDHTLGWREHVKFMSNSVPAAARQIIGGATLWDGASFDLSEV